MKKKVGNKWEENVKKTILFAGTLLLLAMSLTACNKDKEKPGGEKAPTDTPGTEVVATASPTASPTAPPSKTILEVPDEKTLVGNSFLMYACNCAGEEENALYGLYQSVPDREYGPDAKTGVIWGYEPKEYMEREISESDDGFKKTKWAIKEDTVYDNENTGFYYSFSLPNATYEVTVGFGNPFAVRKVSVLFNGEPLVDQEKIYKFKVTEFTRTYTVTDNELKLKIYNPERGKSTLANPIVSYIIIRYYPEGNEQLLSLYEEAKKTRIEPVMTYTTFDNTRQWKDDEGNLIQAHGGQVQKLTYTDRNGETVTKWFWVGEDKTAGAHGGINAYSSDDLYNWHYEGKIMRNVNSREELDTDEYFKELYADYTDEQLDNVYKCLSATTAIIERPKLLYNEKTNKYVLWFHADGPTETSSSSYAAASAGVCISDNPYGPFRFIDRYRLNTCPDDQKDFYPQSKGMARDMNVFVDDDGTAYIIYSSEENLTLYVSKLNDEYTYLDVAPEKAVYGRDFIRLFPGSQREAPAPFKVNDTYYLMSSGCTGWSPNQARYYRSDSILGDWENMGDPCIGDTNRTTFTSQSTCIFTADDGTIIYMGDRWNSKELWDSRYVWLPVKITDDNVMSIEYIEEWSLE